MTSHALAAEWWENHSNSPNGADYARRIREGDSDGLGYGQYAAIVRKGEARAKAMGLKMPEGEGQTRRERKGKAGKGSQE